MEKKDKKSLLPNFDFFEYKLIPLFVATWREGEGEVGYYQLASSLFKEFREANAMKYKCMLLECVYSKDAKMYSNLYYSWPLYNMLPLQ